MEKKFTYLNSTIHYRILGQGKPVILLHGFGEDSHIWDEQINYLQNYFLLIVPDLPGSGKSEILNDQSGVWSLESGVEIETQNSKFNTQNYPSIADFADCIYALLKNENIESIDMLGHSMGGYITLAFYEKYPEMLTGFGLIHSSAFEDSAERKIAREKSVKLVNAYDSHSFLKNTIPILFGAAYKKHNQEKINSLIEAAKNFSKAALVQYLWAMRNRPDRTAVLKSNPLPILFVMGTEDVAAPLEDLLQQIHLPVDSYIHVLQDIGHMGMWEATTAMNQLMQDFINRIKK